MAVELTRKGTINAVDFDVSGAPDLPTAKGKQTMRPSRCTVKLFGGGEAGKVEVTGRVVSKATGELGKRVASENYVLYRPDLPDVVHEIARVAEAHERDRRGEQAESPSDTTVELTYAGNVKTVDYDIAGAPDVPTANGQVAMRPSWCEVRFSGDALEQVTVHGNVVSKATGDIGNRLGTEVFVVASDAIPPFVAEIVAIAERDEQARTGGG